MWLALLALRNAIAVLMASLAIALLGFVDKGVVGRLAITTGETEGALVEVVKGLKGEEQIVSEGKELVRSGQKVRTEARK